MPRGGYRENAGRKSTWSQPETQVIRVPKAIAPQLIEIAKKLDRGESIDFVTKSTGEIYDTEDVLIDSVTESIGLLISELRSKNVPLSQIQKDHHWDKARGLLTELDGVLNRIPVLESATDSKTAPGQMSLLDFGNDLVGIESAAHPSQNPENFTLRVVDLARRWGQKSPSISRAKKEKTREEFIEFSKGKEREKGYDFGWEYLPKIGRFKPVDISSEQLQELIAFYRVNPLAP